ncbi:hypothetical protein ACFLYC_00870 [Chloroflexota bacterium]
MPVFISELDSKAILDTSPMMGVSMIAKSRRRSSPDVIHRSDEEVKFGLE